MTKRSTLKGYFKKGDKPTESQFAEFIDSTLNFDDDVILKLPNDPLSIKATGTDESLINFYRIEKNENKLTWQLKQKSGDKVGLSISDAGGVGRLFIDSGTSNVGIGTTSPKSKLAVAGGMAIGLTYAGAKAAPPNDLLVEGNVGIGTTDPKAKLHVHGPSIVSGIKIIPGKSPDSAFLTFGDRTGWKLHIGQSSDEGATKFVTIEDYGNVGTGTTDPKAKLDVNGDVFIGTGIKSENHKLVIRGPNEPTGEQSHQDLSYEFTGAGSAKVRAYRGGSRDTHLQFLTNASDTATDNPQVRLHIDGAGNVGIGTINPTVKLDVNGNLKVKGTVNINNSQNQNCLSIDSNGNVSIGATNLKANLDVNGNLKVNGQLTKLDVADNANDLKAIVRCADFCIGYSSRKGAFDKEHNLGKGQLGRALIDDKDTLSINHDADWSKVKCGGTLNVTSIVNALNTQPLREQLVRRRIIYGLVENRRLAYKGKPEKVCDIYGPFGYAVPNCQNGAKRKYRLYAIYSDYRGTSTLIRFSLDDNTEVIFKLDVTNGSVDITRDGYSNWYTSEVSKAHGKVEIKMDQPPDGSDARLYYLELQTFDEFSSP